MVRSGSALTISRTSSHRSGATLGGIPPPRGGLGTSDPRVTSPYQMLVSDCTAPTALPGCGGGDNLMFWLLGPGQQGILSPGQAAVMRASPLVE